jgi:drug/metabolite transporter (DMT)-like permease
MGDTSGRARAALAAMAGAALIGLAPILVRLSELGPQATNLWRFLFALPILAILAARAPKPSRRQVGWLLLGGVLFGFELGLWAAALSLTTIANATLLANMTPVFAAAFGWLLFRERLAGAAILGGLTALTGAVVLALARAQAGEGPSTPEAGWLGDGMGLVAALGYAGYLLIVRSLGRGVSVWAVMFWATLSAAAYALTVSLALRETLLPHTLQGWAILVTLGLVTQFAGQGFIAYGVGRLPIVVSTVLLWMQPLAAAGLSWIIFGEQLGPLAFVGAGLVLAGIFVVQRNRQ